MQGLGGVSLAQTKRCWQHRGSAKGCAGLGAPQDPSEIWVPKVQAQKIHPMELVPALVSAPIGRKDWGALSLELKNFTLKFKEAPCALHRLLGTAVVTVTSSGVCPRGLGCQRGCGRRG